MVGVVVVGGVGFNSVGGRVGGRENVLLKTVVGRDCGEDVRGGWGRDERGKVKGCEDGCCVVAQKVQNCNFW